jgi:hypothetical protein
VSTPPAVATAPGDQPVPGDRERPGPKVRFGALEAAQPARDPDPGLGLHILGEAQVGASKEAEQRRVQLSPQARDGPLSACLRSGQVSAKSSMAGVFSAERPSS